MIDTIHANSEMVDPIILVADDQGVLKDSEGQACNKAGQKVGEQGNWSLVKWLWLRILDLFVVEHLEITTCLISSMLTDLWVELIHSRVL